MPWYQLALDEEIQAPTRISHCDCYRKLAIVTEQFPPFEHRKHSLGLWLTNSVLPCINKRKRFLCKMVQQKVTNHITGISTSLALFLSLITGIQPATSEKTFTFICIINLPILQPHCLPDTSFTSHSYWERLQKGISREIPKLNINKGLVGGHYF